MFAADQKAQTVIEKQIIINATGSKQDAESLANTIVKVLRSKGICVLGGHMAYTIKNSNNR